MTDHSPELVDRVARALQDHDLVGGSSYWRWDELHPERQAELIDMARAAIDAMPQPIGYGIRVDDGVDQWLDESLFTTQKAATAEAARPGYDIYNERTTTVVALVPVEDQ